jgi:hypothetical protein
MGGRFCAADEEQSSTSVVQRHGHESLVRLSVSANLLSSGCIRSDRIPKAGLSKFE